MTKSQLISLLSEKSQFLSRREVEESVRLILEMMSDNLANAKRIEIRGFGSFTLHQRPARIGRNPKTGATVHIPEKKVPHFKPGKELRERVNEQAVS